MPGKGCLERKAQRKQLRRRIADVEGELDEPAAKLLKTGDAADLASLASKLGIDLSAEDAAPRTWAEVPPLEDLSAEDLVKAEGLCWALSEACVGFGAEGCTVFQLGSHFKVQQLRKDPLFARQRLLDILLRHADVFDVVEEEGGGHRVFLQESVAACLPAEAPVLQGGHPLPEIDEAASTPEEKLQSFRIVLLHELYKRGGKAMLHDLGQEAKIVEMRKDLLGGRTLLQFIKSFEGVNFHIEDLGHGNFTLELLSADVSDWSAVQALAGSQRVGGKFGLQAAGEVQGKGKGKGKGKGVAVPSAAPGLQLLPAVALGKGKGKGKPVGRAPEAAPAPGFGKGALAALGGAAGADDWWAMAGQGQDQLAIAGGSADSDDWWDWWDPEMMMQMMTAMKGVMKGFKGKAGKAGKGAGGPAPGGGGVPGAGAGQDVRLAWPAWGPPPAGGGKGCGWKGAAPAGPMGKGKAAGAGTSVFAPGFGGGAPLW